MPCFVFSPQTNIGSILASVNPYKPIPGLYSVDAIELYRQHRLGELPPHIFATANECYCCLWKRHDSQCVLIRSERGELAALWLHYVPWVGGLLLQFVLELCVQRISSSTAEKAELERLRAPSCC